MNSSAIDRENAKVSLPATMTAIQNDKELKAYYERKIAEGKNKFSVLNATKNKLLSRIWATVRRGTPYVELCNYA